LLDQISKVSVFVFNIQHCVDGVRVIHHLSSVFVHADYYFCCLFLVSLCQVLVFIYWDWF